MSKRTPRDPVARFNSRISIATTPDGLDGPCWLWDKTTPAGYGMFWTGVKVTQAHRWSYEHHVGPIPNGLHIDHLCRVRHCVNPAHLEAVTCRENLLRGETWAARNATRTVCEQGLHDLSGANVITDKRGWRRCRSCKNEQQREAARKRRQRTAK